MNSIWPEGKYELSAASSVEQPDQTKFVFKIKPNAKFQQLAPTNGRAVTSEDIAVSFNTYKDDSRSSGVKAVFTQFMEKLETPDASTVVYTAKAPNAWLLEPHALAANVPTAFAPKELVAGDQMQKVAVGSGGFHLEAFDPSSQISFTRRPDGWLDERPYLDRVVYKVISDATARTAALRSKQLDALDARDKLEAEEFKTFGAGIRLDRELSYPSVLWMRSDRAPFNDVRVRQAVATVLDIKDLIQRLELGEGEWTAPVPPHLKKWALPADEIKPFYPADLKKARDLLTAGGWDFNREVEYKFANLAKDSLLAEVVQKQLVAVGMKVKLIPQDSVAFSTQTYNVSDFQLCSSFGSLTGGDANYFLQYWSTTGSGNGNKTLFSDPELDALIQKQQIEYDTDKQLKLLLDLQRTILAKNSSMILMHAPYTFTGRWDYYHPALASTWGWAGAAGQHAWMGKKE